LNGDRSPKQPCNWGSGFDLCGSCHLYTSERSRNDEGLVYNTAQYLAPFMDEPACTIPHHARQVRVYNMNKQWGGGVPPLRHLYTKGPSGYFAVQPNALRGCVRVYLMKWRRLFSDRCTRP
jgi:hypothetical protein